jgi:hypothetical protein
VQFAAGVLDKGRDAQVVGELKTLTQGWLGGGSLAGATAGGAELYQGVGAFESGRARLQYFDRLGQEVQPSGVLGYGRLSPQGEAEAPCDA